MKLSKRLQQIDHMISKKYDHIWDCCCDHGFLGMNLLTRNAASKIHFVDIVEPLMNEIEAQLLKSHTKHSKTTLRYEWQVHCLGAEKIPIQNNSSNLVIIAGVGGDLLIEIVEAILTKYPSQDLEFLLCPVHHNYKVRQALIHLGLGLIDESLVIDNRRFYEIIHASTDAKQPISNVGSLMWDFSRRDDREYLSQTLAHYERMQKTDNSTLFEETQNIISAYRRLII
jgi:tRNA (adenine22-N1)-methyltransferase